MREMKDSGVEWIGEIPNNWNAVKLKYLFGYGDDGLKIGPFGSAMKGKTLEEGPVKIYNQAHLIQNDFNLNRHFVSEETYEELKSYEIKPGDVLFSMMGTIGKCQIMPEGYPKGIMDSHLLKSGLNEKIVARFFLYAYDKDFSDQVIQQLLYASNGTIMNGLNSSILKNVYIALPEIDEQKIIADYLDTKCSQIDSIIEKQQAIIEKLKEYKLSVITEAVTKGLNPDVDMKDSGIEWVGNIPASWNVTKTSLLYEIKLGKMLQPNQENEDDTLENYLCAINLGGNKLKYDVIKQMWFSKKEKADYLVKKGDLLVVEGGDVASCDIVKDEVHELYIQNALHRVRSYSERDVRFLRYFLIAAKRNGYMDLVCNKATIAHFSKEKFMAMRCTAPPIEEQSSICDYLDNAVDSIEKTISDRLSIIQKLQEYKKSLIYEVVTGKKEV